MTDEFIACEWLDICGSCDCCTVCNAPYGFYDQDCPVCARCRGKFSPKVSELEKV